MAGDRGSATIHVIMFVMAYCMGEFERSAIAVCDGLSVLARRLQVTGSAFQVARLVHLPVAPSGHKPN
jgi:hypothetical protein